MMLLLWTSILLCVQQCVVGAPGQTSDIMLEMLKKYETKSILGSSDAGEPLYLTPYIQKKQAKEAQKAAQVDSSLFLDKKSYAGYLTVNEEYNANLFFWYFPVSGKPVEETPWILWLQGGPGVSSLFGLFTEIGPFAINDQNVEEMEYSWGKKHSLLFIDNPVGAGFSFTDDKRGYANNQTTIAENLYNALQQFLTIFPELRKAPLTIAGESYAGKHIPSIGYEIHRNKKLGEPINLQGLAQTYIPSLTRLDVDHFLIGPIENRHFEAVCMEIIESVVMCRRSTTNCEVPRAQWGLAIGNGLIDPESLAAGYGDFLREVGLVDDRQADEFKTLEADIRIDIQQHEMLSAQNAFGFLLNTYIQDSHLSQNNLYNFLEDSTSLDHTTNVISTYVQQDNVRKALHVGNSEFNGLNHYVYGILRADIMNSAKPWLEELLDNYKVMLYNGHLDVIVGYRPSVHTYNALNFSGAAEYRTSERKPWTHNHFVAGYYKTGGNLLEVMVRGAGHMVPSDKPSAALGLISAFVKRQSLSSDTGHLVTDTGSLVTDTGDLTEDADFLVEHTGNLIQDTDNLNEGSGYMALDTGYLARDQGYLAQDGSGYENKGPDYDYID